jgi:hypothetical protein
MAGLNSNVTTGSERQPALGRHSVQLCALHASVVKNNLEGCERMLHIQLHNF